MTPTTKLLRILMVSLYTPPWTFAGAGNQAVLLGNALVQRGLAVTLITSAPTDTGEWWETHHLQELPVVKLQSHPNTLLRCIYFQILSALWWIQNAGQFDVIHIHGCTHLTTVIWALMGQLWRKPVLYKITCDGVDDLASIGQTKGLLGKTALSTMKRCQGFIALTPVLAQKLAKVLPKDRIIAITNGVDTDVFKPVESAQEKRKLREELGLPKEAPLLIYTGGITPRKNLGFLVESLAELHQKGTDQNSPMSQATLIIVGPCKDKNRAYRIQVQDKVESLGLVNHVQWIDEVPYTDLAPYLRASDVFVFASKQEGQPSSPLEALACGLPVVVKQDETDDTRYVNAQHTNLSLCDTKEAFIEQVLKQLETPLTLTSESAHNFEPSVRSIAKVYSHEIYPRLITLQT